MKQHTRNCKTCESVFTITSKKPLQKFCSHACYSKSLETSDVLLVCKQCNKQFIKTQSPCVKSAYCSRRCSAEDHRKVNSWSTDPATGAIRVELANDNFCLVDAEDWERLKQYCWSKNSLGYIVSNLSRRTSGHKAILMHREVMFAKPDQLVDHINNGELFDNRKHNLRLADKSENACNRIKNRTGTYSSKYLGVYFDKAKKRWTARVMKRGRSVSSTHRTEQEAVLARDKMALELHKDFARLNFPQEQRVFN